MRQLRPSSLLVLLLLASPGVRAQPAAPEKKIFEEWSIVMLEGKRCGFDSTITTQTDDPGGVRYHTVEQQEFVAKRMGTTMKLIMTSKVTEDADGGVLSFEDRMEGGGSNISSTGSREGDDMVVTSRGQTQRFHVPRLAALGPEAVRRANDAMPLRAGQTISLPTFETDYPQGPVLEQGTVVGQEDVEVNGAKRRLWKVSSTTSIAGGMPTLSWVDDQSNDVMSRVNLPGLGKITEIVSSRAECMKQPEGTELFTTSLIRPQRAIPSVHWQKQAWYRITSNDKEPFKLWDHDEQRIVASQPGMIEFVVTVPHIVPSDAAWELPCAETPELKPYLEPSPYLESNSPIIQALARKAVGQVRNPVWAAHRIETFVENYITKKDLNVVFGSAEETAKSREGDCTEHAVLCAALGRAVGLPTRCVFGLGYIPPGENEPTIANATGPDTGIFGFHMWAEAWIAPGKWIAMDAALGGFDVGHIAVMKTALQGVDPLTDIDVSILRLSENVKIEVLKTVPKLSAPPPSSNYD